VQAYSFDIFGWMTVRAHKRPHAAILLWSWPNMD